MKLSISLSINDLAHPRIGDGLGIHTYRRNAEKRNLSTGRQPTMSTKRIHGVARLRATFATNLREAMLSKGMSQSDVARAVWRDERTDKHGFVQPVGKDRISAYVNGKVLPTEETLAKIAAALDTTPEKLLGEREQPEDVQNSTSITSSRPHTQHHRTR